MSANTYASQYPPAVAFDPAYKEFFASFYATSDAPDAHEAYVKYFTEDATLIMASKKVVGRDGSSCGLLFSPSRPKAPFALPLCSSETLSAASG